MTRLSACLAALIAPLLAGGALLGAVDAPPTPAPIPAVPVPVPLPPRPLHLAEAVQLSAASVPVSIARLDTALARASLNTERTALQPTLNATASATRSKTYVDFGGVAQVFSPDNTFDARLHLGQALLDLDAWNRVAAAGRRLAAAEAGDRLALEDAAGNAGEAYVELARSQALLVVRRDDLALAEELLKLTRAQVDLGAAEGIAATRAENRVAAARSALTTAEGYVQLAAVALARALSLPPGNVLAASDELDGKFGASTAPDELATALKVAHGGRPELQVSLETLAALEADRRAARGQRLPRIDGFADGGRIGRKINDTDTSWEVGVQLTIPLLDRDRYHEEISDRRLAQQRLRFDDLTQGIDAEVRDAVIQLQTGRAVLVSTTEERDLAEREVKEARDRFAAGAGGSLDLIDAQRGLTRAQEQLVTARQVLALAQIRLARAVGGAVSLH